MIAESRAAVRAALEAAGLQVVAVGDRFVSPVAIIEPGDPWVTAVGLGGRMREFRWFVHLVSGRADAPAQAAELDSLAELADMAFAYAPAAGLSAASFAQPAGLSLAGIDYLAVRVTVVHRVAGGSP